ncbi:lactonase family protein [Agromyces indicus]|uniref:Lactonase family protein n=1 Tax=Agromyces indicus TaxID=758919 RepID=A0ABU1FFR1_9MICO|nr:lactonase family protein [Agromyces indicus]MDR5690599.1 lactonase family protein [Agromyces indicus]
MTTHDDSARRLVAFVGAYASGPAGGDGGITVLAVEHDGDRITRLSGTTEPKEAGYLVYSPSTSTLYSVDERKTDGRGPVDPPAAVHAFRVDQADGGLTPLNWRAAPGPRPTYLALDADRGVLVCANHGDFEHVERIIRTAEGWDVEYVYDDSTVLLYGLESDGAIGRLRDVVVFDGHGPDPNTSPQAGGHAQASGHAHCAVIDRSGRYVVVCDKATDLITVFTLGDRLTKTSEYRMPPQTGPRHLVFDIEGTRAYVTCEFSSEVASFTFDPENGTLELIEKVTTTGEGFTGLNEPADLRLHPYGRFVYVNNRGEDSLAWFHIDESGRMTRVGHVPLSRSIHPGLAARSFAFAPSGSLLLVADRPANLVRAYRVDGADGRLEHLGDSEVADPAFIEFAELGS